MSLLKRDCFCLWSFWNCDDAIFSCRFCPSVFLYLTSVVPAIWLLELDKVDRRLRVREEFNLTSSAGANLKEINNLIGVSIL